MGWDKVVGGEDVMVGIGEGEGINGIVRGKVLVVVERILEVRFVFGVVVVKRIGIIWG